MSMPAPPANLAVRVGAESDGSVADYLSSGEAFHNHLMAALPAGFDLSGKRVLDFGCGPGRIMMHMVGRNAGVTFEGCDIYEPSVEWLNAHLSAPHVAFLSSELPPLDRPDGHYAMIYATSVFTHLAASWSVWLLELHRLLADGGLLMATHIGPAFAKTFEEDPWQEERIGMLTLLPGNSWAAGGPTILHSQWWIRAHWGRCFEVVSFEPDGFGNRAGTPFTQGLVVLRKRAVELSPAQLEALEPGEPREITALQHGLERAHRESMRLNHFLDTYASAYAVEAKRALELDASLNAYAKAYIQESARTQELNESMNAYADAYAKEAARSAALSEQLQRSLPPRRAARALLAGVRSRAKA